MLNKNKLILGIILLIGILFRFYQLAEYPVSLSIDEVAVGYNAYSLLKTGNDEYGVAHPLAFKSVGDYKSPLLIYLTVPSIAVFGLTEFGVRLPIALVSVLTIYLVFLLIKEITNKEILALIGAFSLAVSPWHTFYSRFSHDAILGLFLVLLGVLIFIKSVKNSGRFLWLASIFFGLSFYGYHAERIFTPLLIILLVLIYYTDLLKVKKSSIFAFVVLIIVLLPFGKMMLGPEGLTRAKMTFIASDENISYQLHQTGDNLQGFAKILDNNFVILGNFWAKRYLNYWDPGFLFFSGMNFTRPGWPGTGLFYFFEIPVFVVGVCLLFFTQIIKDPKSKKLIVVWLLLGPLAASLANNDQHASRSLTTIPIPQIIIALGFYQIFSFLRKSKLFVRVVVAMVISSIICLNIAYVADQFFIHYTVQFSEYWDYGYKEAVLYAINHQKEYDEIIIDSAFGTQGPYIIGTPHLYVLFYGKIDPAQSQTERNSRDEKFSNFNFRTIYWPNDKYKKNTLFIGSPWRLPLEDLNKKQIIKTIYFKNGKPGFLIVKT